MTNRSLRKIASILLLIPVFATSVYSVPLLGSAGISFPGIQFQKGMSYVTWSEDSFASPASDESMKSMAQSGIQCVSLVVTLYQETYNSTDIVQTERTPSDDSLRHAIKRAHALGMKVMLKPHIDLIRDEGNTRSDIGFNTEDKWKKWFDSYSRMIGHYAGMARDEGVELFCVGTELTFASTKTDFWKDRLIPFVKSVFRGQVVYAANWDEYSSIKFWDSLDYIGIDAYFPLSDKDNPSMGELMDGWKRWLGDIESFQKNVNKPVIFTESGYPSADSAARKPWEEPKGGSPNPGLQAKCYKALLDTFWGKPWFYGVYWWNWNTYAGSGENTKISYTPQNRPALEHIKCFYACDVRDEKYYEQIIGGNTGDRELIDKVGLESDKAAISADLKDNGIIIVGERRSEDRYRKPGME